MSMSAGAMDATILVLRDARPTNIEKLTRHTHRRYCTRLDNSLETVIKLLNHFHTGILVVGILAWVLDPLSFALCHILSVYVNTRGW